MAERKGPLSVFPEELWGIILNDITDPVDVKNVASGDTLWKNVVQSRAHIWMFEIVFPYLFHYLSGEDILNCRLICQGWNTTIEKYLENDQPILHVKGGYFQKFIRSLETNMFFFRKPGQTIFTMTSNYIWFYQKMDINSNKNQFLSRSVYCDFLQQVRLNSPMDIFFQTFGRHIWYLTLKIDPVRASTTLVEYCELLWKILGNLPNLKKLVLEFRVTLKFVARELKVNPESVKQLTTFLKSHRPPALPQLTALSVLVTLHPSIQRTLETAYASQLLVLSQKDLTRGGLQNAPNVTHLTVQFHKRNKTEIANLKKMVFPKLEHLYLDMIKVKAVIARIPCPAHVWEAVETFQGTLKGLTMYWNMIEDQFPQQIDLPRLEEFQDVNEEGKDAIPEFSLCFLKSFKGLLKLTLVFPQGFYCQFFSGACAPVAETKGKSAKLTVLEKRKAKGVLCRECAGRQKPDQIFQIKNELGVEEEKIDLLDCLDELATFEKFVVQESGVEILNEAYNLKKPYNSNVWRLVPSLQKIVIRVVKNGDRPLIDDVRYTGPTISKCYIRNELVGQSLK